MIKILTLQSAVLSNGRNEFYILKLRFQINFMKLKDLLAKLGILRFGKIKWKVKRGRDLPYPAIDNSAFRNEDVMFNLGKKKKPRRR